MRSIGIKSLSCHTTCEKVQKKRKRGFDKSPNFVAKPNHNQSPAANLLATQNAAASSLNRNGEKPLPTSAFLL